LFDGVHLAHGDNLLVVSGAFPIFGVAIRESDQTIAGVDALDAGLGAAVEGSLDFGAVGQLDQVRFECDWKTFVID
jgi:hypothetical protein